MSNGLCGDFKLNIPISVLFPGAVPLQYNSECTNDSQNFGFPGLRASTNIIHDDEPDAVIVTNIQY